MKYRGTHCTGILVRNQEHSKLNAFAKRLNADYDFTPKPDDRGSLIETAGKGLESAARAGAHGHGVAVLVD